MPGIVGIFTFSAARDQVGMTGDAEYGKMLLIMPGSATNPDMFWFDLFITYRLTYARLMEDLS